MSSDLAGNQTQAERVSFVQQLLAGEEGEPERDQDDSDSNSGDETPGTDSGDDTTPEPDDIAALFDTDGVEDDTEGAPGDDLEGADGHDPEEGHSITVKDLAGKLGIEAKDLYDELTIPLGDGETTTLGEWKDRVKSLRDLDSERTEVTDKRNELEKTLLQTRSEMNNLLSVIPPEMREQMVGMAQDKTRVYQQEQEQAVLEAIPAWKDQDNMAKDRGGIVNMGSEYGFSEQEITYTQDARTLRMLHDFLRLRERVGAMETAAKRKPGQPNGPGKSKTQTRKSRKLADAIYAAKQSPDRRKAESVVSHLLRNQK